MAEKIRLSVITGDETVLAREADYVNLPTGSGSVGILADHAPMLCAVSKGVLRGTDGEESFRVAVGTGVACVRKNELTVLVSDANRIEES